MDTDSHVKAFLKRWFFPCTLLVIIYLLFCTVVCVVYWDTELFGRNLTFFRLALVELGLLLVVSVSFPGTLMERWGGWFPPIKGKKRCAIAMGYVSLVVIIAVIVWWILERAPPYPIWLYFLPRAFPCLLYLYLCAVENYPFGRGEKPPD